MSALASGQTGNPGPPHVRTVGIMSMHRVHNYGSSLQAFALRETLHRLAPTAVVDFIDFPATTPVRTPRLRVSTQAQKAYRYWRASPSVSDWVAFVQHKRRYAEKYFREVGIPIQSRLNTSVDLQIVGSDEVFNCLPRNTGTGFTPALFGHGSHADRLASYAASFGHTTIDALRDLGIHDAVRSALKNFHSISVRDANSAHIVSELLGTSPPVHVDPTLIYDFSDVVEQGPLPTGDYMIVYGYPGRFTTAENQAVRRFADRNGLRVVAIGGLQQCADTFLDCSPLEVLGAFQNAHAVVTDTFHGTIFSIIAERPFVTVLRTSEASGYGNEEKLGHLLETFGLTARVASATADISAVLSSSLAFTEVRRRRKEMQANALSYLRGLLS